VTGPRPMSLREVIYARARYANTECQAATGRAARAAVLRRVTVRAAIYALGGAHQPRGSIAVSHRPVTTTQPSPTWGMASRLEAARAVAQPDVLPSRDEIRTLLGARRVYLIACAPTQMGVHL
jgi:hypothetical protein